MDMENANYKRSVTAVNGASSLYGDDWYNI